MLKEQHINNLNAKQRCDFENWRKMDAEYNKMMHDLSVEIDLAKKKYLQDNQ